MESASPLSVSIPDAVKMTGVGRSSLYAAIKTGALSVRKAGRRTVVPVDALKAWLASLPEGGKRDAA